MSGETVINSPVCRFKMLKELQKMYRWDGYNSAGDVDGAVADDGDALPVRCILLRPVHTQQPAHSASAHLQATRQI
jgi:hypothetical protein